MNLRNYFISGAVSAVMAGGFVLLSATPTVSAAEEDVEILTRGPVHEAFAEAVSLDPVPGIIVRVAPPESIEEIPPEHQLEGDNVTWIPGYWAWDEERNDFIWISGIWRNVPPDRQWVPGYWNAIGNGEHQWTSGYWADSAANEAAYIPEAPPRSLEVGPNVAAPSADHSWIPGNWVWSDTRYNWRPGYWVGYRPHWTWVPSRYVWTRHGYVYVDGYWDYAVARRGVLFAPVYYRHHVYTAPDYYYSPLIVVALSVFSDHLFVRPRYGHYYFGDYYSPYYRDSGIYVSFSWHSSRGGYDPIYAYDRWHHRRDRGWEDRRRREFDYFRDNEDARPPRTWAAMREFREDRFDDGRNRRFATTLASAAEQPMEGQRFRKLDKERREKFVSQGREMRKFRDERRQIEASASVAGEGTEKSVVREKIKRSPIMGRETERLAKDEAPPKRPEARASERKEQASGKSDRKTLDRKADASTQRKTEGKPEREAESASQRKAEGKPERKTESAPQRKAEGKPERKAESAPQRKAEGAPQRKAEGAPQRKAENAPQRKAENAPQRKAENAPERKAQPQVREVPQRKAQEQVREAPQRKAQSQVREAPQRKAQPQVREAPQRKAQPQVREAPQRKAQPQVREAPQRKPQPQVRESAQRKPQSQVREAPQPKAPSRTEQRTRRSNEEEEKKAR